METLRKSIKNNDFRDVCGKIILPDRVAPEKRLPCRLLAISLVRRITKGGNYGSFC